MKAEFETNFFGALHVVQSVLPILRGQQRGHILGVSSVAGVVAGLMVGFYDSSKWALEALHDSLSQEVAGFGIKVALIELGAYTTDFSSPSSFKLSEGIQPYALRQQVFAHSVHIDSGEPQATADAVPQIVDMAYPPLRVFLGIEGMPAVRTAYVVGSGTGVFTHSLPLRGVREQDLTLIEFNEEFAHRLRRRFPKARVICTSAANVGRVDFKRGASVGAVISGLPLLSTPASTVSAILRGSFEHLRKDGDFFQITYACRNPVDEQTLDRLGLQANLVGSTWVNLPPASVHGIRRSEEPR